MHKINLWLCILALTSCMLLFTTCTQAHEPITLKGKIHNAIGNESIEGIKFSIESNRCGLAGLSNCDLVHHEDISGKDGQFRLYFTQDCANEFHIKIPEELKASYPKYRLDIYEKSERYLSYSCQNNVIIYPEINYNFDIILQPQVTLYMRATNSTSHDIQKISVPEYGIEMNELIEAGASKNLDIKTMKGVIDIEILYTDGSQVLKSLEYDYLYNQVITLDIVK